MSVQTETVVNPTKVRYGDKEFTIGSLGLTPPHAYALYRVVKMRRPDGVLDGIGFDEIMSIRTVGITKAKGIAAALAKLGIEVKGTADILKIEEIKRVELVPNKGGWGVVCTACGDEFYDNMDRPKYRFCPMCGKRLGKEY
jgi:hypothetical protein